jgi:two-component system response regulator FlrC
VLATTNRRLREEVAAGRFREDLYYRLNVFPLAISPLSTRRDDVLPLAMQLLARRVRPGDRIPALSADAAHLLLTYNWPGNVRELDNLLQRALILVNGPVIGPEHIQFELVNETCVPSDTGTFRTFTPMAGTPHRQPAHVPAQPAGANGDAWNGRATASSQANADAWLARASAASQASAPTDASLARTLGNAEKDLILEALRSGSPRREVAERLGISPRTLRHKLARLREAGVEVPAA